MGVFNTNRGGTNLPEHDPFEVLQTDADNNLFFGAFTIPGTGDYYVSSNYGLDAPGSGGILKPYKTIQYAAQQVELLGVGNNIIVRKGVYNYPDPAFPAVQNITFNGTLTFEAGATVNVSLTDPNNYLLDNVNTVIAGTSVFNLYSGRFLRNTLSFTNRSVKITGVSVVSSTGGFIDIQGTNATPSNSTISSTTFESCSFSRFISSGGVNELFANADMRGSFFYFSKCNFAAHKLTFSNYSFNGGSYFVDCSFYGQQTGIGQEGYIFMGASNNVGRLMIFKRCNFDIQTIDDALQAKAIKITASGVVFNMSSCSFDRYSSTNKFSIWSDFNYGIIASNTFSGVPKNGTGVVTEYVPNGFQYVTGLPVGFSF